MLLDHNIARSNCDVNIVVLMHECMHSRCFICEPDKLIPIDDILIDVCL